MTVLKQEAFSIPREGPEVKQKILKLFFSAFSLPFNFCSPSFRISLFLFLFETVSPQSIHFDNLTTADGLSNNNVYDLIQDRTGFLWFATDDGLNSFDGYEFKIFRHEPLNRNSLSNNSVWTIAEDKQGKIWAGTKNGTVNCYDPVTEKFKSWIIKSNLTKENTITFILEDSKKRIWIGTYRSGLYKLDPATGKTENWQYDKNDPASISIDFISSIVEDNNGKLWISTYNGLNKFDPDSPGKGFTRYYNEAGNPNSITDNVVWYLSRSRSDPDLIWIGTAGGLTSLSLKQGKEIFTRIKIDNPANLQFGTSAGSVIEETGTGEKVLWIDSYGGLLRLNLSSGMQTRFTFSKNDPNSLASNHISRMIRDRSGVLWLATENGLSYFSPKKQKFNNKLYGRYSHINSGELYKKNLKAVTQTPDGRIWFGTEEGLFYLPGILNRDSKIKIVKGSESLNVWSLTPGTSNDLWIGTYGSGLFRLDLETNKVLTTGLFKKYKLPAINYNKAVILDNKNNLWIGFWGIGLARYNPQTGEYKHWVNEAHDTASLSHNDVWALCKDRKGRVWIGTNGGGLNLFVDKEEGKFIRLTAEEDSISGKALNSNTIYSICESGKRQYKNETVLWIGTNNGLNKFVIDESSGRGSEKRKEDFKYRISYYGVKEGLSDNSVKSLIEDDRGNLWLGTSSGISMFNPDNETFINFTGADGISGRDFNFSSAFKDPQGIIFMGSSTGLNYFNPADIVQSSYAPPVAVTDFQIFNTSVSRLNPEQNEAGELPLNQSILFTDEIVLSHKENVFSFQFSALDYNSPSSIRYAYMMEGFDEDWVYGGARRFVTYTNLNPGGYLFKVKSTNSDGIWNKNITSVKVIITPPWWQTGWALAAYFIVLIIGIWGIMKFQANRSRLQTELRMHEFESNHLREIEKMKSRFFANLSHEFRTPLMLIKGPLEELIKGRINENLNGTYKMILRNTEKLQNLIDQLLELSQLEAASIPLRTGKHSLVTLLEKYTSAFLPLAGQKNITLNFKPAGENLTALVDTDKLEKIINNLLSNAFKFTPDGGKISVELSHENTDGRVTALISVSDSGIGIPEEYLPKIFDRFFQVDISSQSGKLNGENRNYGGSGIGLALVKELAALHKWQISVKSREGDGTVFILKIPAEKENISAGETIITAETESKPEEFTEASDYKKENQQVINEEVSENKKENGKEKILIVEDSPDVRNFISDILNYDYEVVQAEDGQKGFALASECMPDLIISDIMMPGMDGIEFCSLIKKDWQTSHIPVVLLTARATRDSRIEGLETGADDYITKPFNFDELKVRIKNLIRQRKLLREKFSKEINIHPGSEAINLLDKEFMQKLLAVIEENLRDETFNSECLAEKLFVSRSRLHRKLQAITGQGPGEFIRIYKLKRAAQMIIENKLSITQIAYEVGFGSPAQFTRAFQKYFGCLPSEFRSEYKV